jgi:hypothetical protein
MSVELGIFKGRKEPDVKTVWELYSKGCDYNRQINLDETVKVNENFYVGKQWEGVQANGLPTPVFNFLKRVVGFITATINSDNIKVNASALDNTPDTAALNDPVRIVNEEFEALVEHNSVPSLNREFTRNAAVDGDGCTYTYWDEDVPIGGGKTGAIRTEILPNTRVFFGNPNDRSVQDQPYIQIASREIARRVMKRAKANGCENWEQIQPDDEATGAQDEAKSTDDKATVILTLWKDEETGEVWGYESTRECEVRKPWNLNIRLYPITWLNWDYIQDSYHGQAMITGLIPNQIFVNKAWAMSMLSMMRSAWPKFVYDKTRIAKWDNRVGAAIGINGGDPSTVARVVDTGNVSPQVPQFISLAMQQSEECLGATKVALGDTRPDNTSAIIALQRAAATPSEMTKQNLYKCVEDMFRIYLEFMAFYYGRRMVDMQTPPELVKAYQAVGQEAPPTVQMEFDFDTLQDYPMSLKLDVGASSYYSEIAAMQTLDNLLMNRQIDVVQYLERIPDGNIPRRRALIEELRQKMQAAQPEMPQAPGAGGAAEMDSAGQKMEIPGGRGYGGLQRAINRSGSTEGIV